MLLGWEHVEYCRVLARAAKHFVRPGKIIFPKVKYRDQSFIPNIHFCYAQHSQEQEDTVACKLYIVKSPTHPNRQSVPHRPERDI